MKINLGVFATLCTYSFINRDKEMDKKRFALLRILFRNLVSSSFSFLAFRYFSGNHLHKYSKVLDPSQLGAIETVPLPECPLQAWSQPKPLNVTAPENLHKQRWLLSVNLDQVGLSSGVLGRSSIHGKPYRGSLLCSPYLGCHATLLPLSVA